jgi:hypothetical protein
MQNATVGGVENEDGFQEGPVVLVGTGQGKLLTVWGIPYRDYLPIFLLEEVQSNLLASFRIKDFNLKAFTAGSDCLIVGGVTNTCN